MLLFDIFLKNFFLIHTFIVLSSWQPILSTFLTLFVHFVETLDLEINFLNLLELIYLSYLDVDKTKELHNSHSLN